MLHSTSAIRSALRLHEGNDGHCHVHIVHPNLPKLQPPQSQDGGIWQVSASVTKNANLSFSILMRAHRYIDLFVY